MRTRNVVLTDHQATLIERLVEQCVAEDQARVDALRAAVLVGDADIEAGRSMVFGGPAPSNPAELVSSDEMRNLIKEAADIYSFVVVDSPPLLNVADSRILASLVKSTVLVVKCGETPRQAVQFAESQARAAGANISGVVLNYIDVRASDYPYHAFHPAENFIPQD